MIAAMPMPRTASGHKSAVAVGARGVAARNVIIGQPQAYGPFGTRRVQSKSGAGSRLNGWWAPFMPLFGWASVWGCFRARHTGCESFQVDLLSHVGEAGIKV